MAETEKIPFYQKTSVFIVIIVSLILVIVIGAYMYKSHQDSAKYQETVNSLVSGLESIEQEQNRLMSAGGRYKDIMDNTRNLATSLTDMKIKISQLKIPSKQSSNLKNSLIAMIDAELAWNQSILNWLQIDSEYSFQKKRYDKTVDMWANGNNSALYLWTTSDTNDLKQLEIKHDASEREYASRYDDYMTAKSIVKKNIGK